MESAREVLSSRGEGARMNKENYSVLEQADDECEDASAGVSERKLQLAFARTTIGVTMREEGTCKVEESVYGAAIVMPQLARTVSWNKTMSTLAIQSWIFLVLNVILQAYLLRLLAKEEVVMDRYGGQMFLCDFGADLEHCPGPGCRGPGGTEISGPRLYSWDAFVNRNFVKDSLKALLPDRIQEIEEKVDPGEYGVESYWCRFACCFIFMVSCMGELAIIYKMVELLYLIPTRSEPWILPKDTDSPEDGSMDDVSVVVAGMPLFWKIVNMLIVVFPKLMLWKLTAETGVTVLMETSGIDDLITNSVGLTFILGLDELIGAALMREESLSFVRACEDFPLFDKKTSCVGDMTALSEDELLEKYNECQHGLQSLGFWDWVNILPAKLLLSILATSVFVFAYYSKHCTPNDQDDHRMVSKSMYLPKTMTFTWLNAFLPHFFPIEPEPEPYWRMP